MYSNGPINSKNSSINVIKLILLFTYCLPMFFRK